MNDPNTNMQNQDDPNSNNEEDPNSQPPDNEGDPSTTDPVIIDRPGKPKKKPRN